MKTNTSPTAAAAYTLKEAVLDAVGTLKSTGSFSAHDVTNTIRTSVNDGEYILPGLEAAAGSAFKYNVNHDSVKQVVDSLLNDGTLANLGLTNVNYSGAYRVFEFAQTTPTADVASGDSSQPDADVNDSPVAKRIATYLAKRDDATVRQVHSALKIAGLTSEALVSLLKELGYTVTVTTEGAFSTYTVE